MASSDSRKRPHPKQQASILSFFVSPPGKKTCTTTDSGDMEPDVANVDHQENADIALLNQPSKSSKHIVNDVLPPSKTLRVDNGQKDTQPLAIDIFNVIGQPSQKITSETKLRIITNRQPEADFKFPPKQYKDSSEKGGVKQRYCSRDWFKMYDFLCYSKSTDGLFCLCCVLFPMPAHHGKKANNLITIPYRNWKDAKTDFAKHVNHEYHRDSKAKMDGFLDIMSKPSLSIQNRLSLEVEKQIVKNRIFLTSIIKCIELCGRQGIGLRGHRDDAASEALNQGNFKALLKLRIDAGDTELHDHLETCARNATYISKTSQNELLQCIKKYIQEVIVQQVKDGGGFFGIGADEVTDTSNWEQLGLVVRYLHNGEPVEKLVEYIECESCTGVAICNHIVQALINLELDPKMCRAQTYDGAGNMAGCQNGCAKQFQKVSPRALYLHCASHELNLALSHASKVAEICNMVCTLKSVGIFFKYSPKRQREFEQCIVSVSEGRESSNEAEGEIDSDTIEDDSDSDDEEYEDGEEEGNIEEEDVELIEPDNPTLKAAKQKIKPLCETRWVERHTAFQDFDDLYEPLLLCLETISLNKDRKKWDAKSKTEAQGLFHQIKNPVFIAAFCTAKYLFGYTRGLSRSLQGTTQDVVEAYKQINLVRDQLIHIRKNAKQVFARLYEKITIMAEKTDAKMSIPRTCGRQTLRNNIKAKTPVTYFRRTSFLPFLDNLLQQLLTRFNGISEAALLGLLLIPANLQKLDESSQEKLLQYYTPDLPSPSSASQELELWKRFW